MIEHDLSRPADLVEDVFLSEVRIMNKLGNKAISVATTRTPCFRA
jgi:hypothetical protein